MRIIVSKKQKSIESNLLTVLILLNICSFFNASILTLFRSFSLLFLPILLIVLIAKNKLNHSLIKDCTFLLIILILSVSTFLYGDKGIGSILNLIYFTVSIVVLTNIEFGTKDLRAITVGNVLINLFYVVQAKGYNEKYYYDFYWHSKDGINPNVIAYIILFSFMFIVIRWYDFTKVKYRTYRYPVLILLLLINVYTILKYESRGSLLAILYFSAFFIIIILSNKKNINFLIKVLFILTIIGSVVFPIIYIFLYTRGIEISISDISKSTYTGREVIWYAFFNSVKNILNALFGIGSNGILHGFTEAADLHNNTLGLITNYGLLTTITYYIMVGCKIFMLLRKKADVTTCLYILAYCSTIVIGYFEATVYFSPIYLSIHLFIGMAIGNKDTKARDSLNISKVTTLIIR